MYKRQVPDYENGKLSSVEYRDKNHKLLKREEYTYSPSSSEEVWGILISKVLWNFLVLRNIMHVSMELLRKDV